MARFADNYSRLRRKATYLASLLSGGLTGASLGLGVGLAMIQSPDTKPLGILIMAAGPIVGLALGLLVAWPILRTIAARRARMLIDGVEVYIGHCAAYFDGRVLYWNTSYRALNAVRFIPGSPAKLEIKVRLSPPKILLILDLLTLLAGQSTAASNEATEKDLITIPSGREHEARQIAALLQQQTGN